MGKLSDLWQQYKSIDYDDPRRIEIQTEINKVESWMISKGYKIDGITKWSASKLSPHYPEGSGAVFFEDLEKDKI